MENLYGIIERPIRTERSTILKDKQNAYVFRVNKSATKPEIKKSGGGPFSCDCRRRSDDGFPWEDSPRDEKRGAKIGLEKGGCAR